MTILMSPALRVKSIPAATALAAEVETYLTRCNYTPAARDAARSWVESRGELTGCPVIAGADAAVVNAIVKRAEDADAGPAPAPRRNAFVPTEADERWWAAYRAGAELPAEPEACAADAWGEGWVDTPIEDLDWDAFDSEGNPIAPAHAATAPAFVPSPPIRGQWSDFDQLAAHGCV